MPARPYVGRFAPSPTGPLHFGSLLAALASWLRARSQGGEWLIRIEDIDPPREQAGAANAILRTLADFGMTSDRPVVYQSRRHADYRTALSKLIAQQRAFPCWCSRTQLATGSVHHGRCPAVATSQQLPSWRLLVPDQRVQFQDKVFGLQQEDVARSVGDYVLWRREDLPSYQLAVVVDDAAQGITEVVRGADLLDSTPRQILLQQQLDLPTPDYLHIPQALGPDGQKLSKQNLAPALDSATARDQLHAALHFLGQPVLELDSGPGIVRLLERATAAFDPGHIPVRLAIAV